MSETASRGAAQHDWGREGNKSGGMVGQGSRAGKQGGERNAMQCILIDPNRLGSEFFLEHKLI